MDKRELKRIWTDVAKGKISKKDAELLIKPKKTRQKRDMKKNTHKRKDVLKKKEALK